MSNNLINLAIGLSIALVVIAYTAPVGLQAIYELNFTAWSFDGGVTEDTKTSGLFKLLPLFFGLALVIVLIKAATGGG